MELWNRTDVGDDFSADLDAHDYIPAIDENNNICIVDSAGDAYCLTELIQGETTSSMCNRMNITDLERLPTIDEAKWLQRCHMKEMKSDPTDDSIPERSVGLRFHIDTNRINARQSLPNMTKLERWHSDGVIILDISEEAYDEARSGNNEVRNEKADERIFIKAADVFGVEKEFRDNIAKLLFNSTSLSRNQKNDIQILFCAKMAGAILITNDGGSKRQPGGILGHAKELASLGIEVMTDEVAVQSVRHRITFRDKAARSVARDTGLLLPLWVGLD
jgi:hypothetical protein